MKLNLIILLMFYSSIISAQYCDSITPSFYADLSASPEVFWISPEASRVGNCCGTSSPDNCIEFEIMLHPDAHSIVFGFYSGAVPPGSLFYQVDCGPQVQVGSPICLDGQGPHHLTFCKPGNNTNEYYIQSIPDPSYGPDITLNEECVGLLGTSNMQESTITWTSVFPGAIGDYNNYLSCTAGCDTVEVLSQEGYPPYVDFQACGNPLNECDTLLSCHTFRVYFNPHLDLDLLPDLPVICYGDTSIEIIANYGGGTPPYQLEWSTMDTTSSIIVGTGTYWLRVTDSSNCPATYDTVNVTQQTEPINSIAGQDDTLCETGIPVQLMGEVTGASGGVWTGGTGTFSTNNSDLNVLYTPSNGEMVQGYTELLLTSTGNFNCEADVDTVRITYVSFTASINLLVEDVSCYNGNDGSASVEVLGNLPPYTIEWSTNEVGSSINNLTDGNYSLFIENGFGCDTIISFQVLEPDPIVNQVTTEDIECSNLENGEVNFMIGGGTVPYQILWDGSILPELSANDTSLQNLSAGNYSFTIYDFNGCDYSSNVVINQTPPLSISITGLDTICYEETLDLAVDIMGGTAPYSIDWSQNSENTPTISFIPEHSGYTFVNVTDSNSCTKTDSIYTYVQTLYQDSLNVYIDLSAICFGEEITLQAEYLGNAGELNYYWSPISLQGMGPHTLSPTESTTYIVTVTDYCNNELIDSVTVRVNPVPEINLSANLGEGCPPLEIEFDLDSSLLDAILLWDYGDGNLGSSNHHVYDKSGKYYPVLKAVNQFGCEATSSGNSRVTVYPTPTAGIDVNKDEVDMYFPFIVFTSNSEGAYSYFWDFDDGDTAIVESIKHEYQEVGIYHVIHTVSNEYGCFDSTFININVKPTANVYIPNAFSPDGDGINDEFFVTGDGLLEDDFSLEIFNRWGELMFSTTDLYGKWDGSYQGSISTENETYAYSVVVRDILNETHIIYGHVISLVK